MRGGRFERQVVELVDESGLGLGELCLHRLQPPVGIGLCKSGRLSCRQGKEHRTAALDRSASGGDRLAVFVLTLGGPNGKRARP